MFMEGDLGGSIQMYDKAIFANATQPMMQRSVALYIAGDYQGAAAQLKLDIHRLEKMKLRKATDMRLWRSAALYQIGLPAEAKAALSLDENAHADAPTEDRPLWKALLELYAASGNEGKLRHVMEWVDSAAETPAVKVQTSSIFYGNFYLGLLFDALGDFSLAEAFLAIPRSSQKFPESDMWYHIPRMLSNSRSFRNGHG